MNPERGREQAELNWNPDVTQEISLRGMAWDHPRAIQPLEAISAEWSAESGVAIDWDARPLKDFEDQPLEELATRYDVILIDHPFVGFASESGLIVPVDDWADATYLADQKKNSVGPSFASYTWRGKQWALAVDAACQVSAVRRDLLSRSKVVQLPRTWDEVAAFAGELRKGPARVAVPLNPNHSYCAFLSVGLSLAGPDFWPTGRYIHADTGIEALEFLRNLSSDLHPISRTSDPIAISDRMADTDEILYVPLMFVYSSYSRPGFKRSQIFFGDAPEGPHGCIGSVLGGVGIALSALSEHREIAADLARLIASREMQSGLYATSGGQPGHAAAWDAKNVNDLVGDCFSETRRTMGQAFLRPRVTGHRKFQVLAGELTHRFIWTKDISSEECIKEYFRLVDELLGHWDHDSTIAGEKRHAD